jgi:uncharacterized protein YndB with AHSA1/START domain
VRFGLRPADTSFVAGARRRFTYDFMVPETPLAVFAAITDPTRLARWVPGVRAARWLTGGRTGVGSLREVAMDRLTVEEQVLVWEPGERFTFQLNRASLPVLRRLAEDFRLSPMAAPGRPRGAATRVQWTIAWQAAPLLGPLERLIRPVVFGRFEESCRRLGAAAHEAASGRG